MMFINDTLNALGKQMGLPELKLDENGICRLIFDKTIIVDMETSGDEKSLHVYSALCPTPQEGREALFTALLEANLFGTETGGAFFAVDMQAEKIIRFRTFDMGKIAYQNFVDTLENFVQQIEDWKEKMDKVETGASDRSDRPDEARPFQKDIIMG